MAWINGIGYLTPAGMGMGHALRRQPLQNGVLEIPTRKQIFAAVDRRFGRLDDFSRVGLAAAAFCLRDADQEDGTEKRPLGIVAASRYGCLATDIAYLKTMLPDGGKLASPNLFAYTLPNSFLGEAALRFGLTGTSLVLNQADASHLAALRFALEELSFSTQQGLLAGIVDLPAPAELATKIGDELPGALFVLLERVACATSYGQLTMNGTNIACNGRTVSDLPELLENCLASKHKEL